MLFDCFQRRTPNPQKLLAYGFLCKGSRYVYQADLMGGQMRFACTVEETGSVCESVTDAQTGEEYSLYKNESAAGAFVGAVRSEVEALLFDISQTCFNPAVFKGEPAQKLISHIHSTYGDELEFLWEKLPDYAVWRRKDSGKWYAVLMALPANRIGIDSSERIEVLNLHSTASDIKAIIDRRVYYPGYHMNKNSWYTVRLDAICDWDELCRRIELSYGLAKSKRKSRT